MLLSPKGGRSDNPLLAKSVVVLEEQVRRHLLAIPPVPHGLRLFAEEPGRLGETAELVDQVRNVGDVLLAHDAFIHAA